MQTPSVKSFEARLDKFWKEQEILYNYVAELNMFRRWRSEHRVNAGVQKIQ